MIARIYIFVLCVIDGILPVVKADLLNLFYVSIDMFFRSMRSKI